MLIECITKNINEGFSKPGSHHERGGEPSKGRALLGLLSTASHKPRPPVKLSLRLQGRFPHLFFTDAVTHPPAQSWLHSYLHLFKLNHTKAK